MRWMPRLAWIYSFVLLAALCVSASDGVAGPSRSKKLKVRDAKVIFCEDVPAPSMGRVCDVAPGGDALRIQGNVLDFAKIYQGGEVLVDGSGLIRFVGCGDEMPADLAELADTATRITCAEGVVSPGLINAHDHLSYDQNAPFPPGVERYDHRNDWRPGSGVPSDGSPLKVQWSELRQAMLGTTAIAGAYGALGFLRNLDIGNHPFGDDLLWNVFTGPPTVIETDTFPLEYGGSFTQHEGDCAAYPRYPVLGRDRFPAADVYVAHVSEGVNAAAQNEFACLSSTERNGTDSVDGGFAMVHGIALDAQDGRTLAAEGASLIWSPRSNIRLYGNTAPVSMLKNQGVLIALSTDWTPSGSATLARELMCADSLNQRYLNGVFSDRELWLMVTRNAALALHVGDRIGALKPGMFGDIAIYDGSGRENPYRAILEARAEDVALVLKRSSLPFPFVGGPDYVGSIALYGDADVLTHLPPSLHDLYAPSFGVPGPLCEPVDVCGASKLACALRETWWLGLAGVGAPVSLAGLQAANSDSYPLFFCEVPPDEPSCIPARPGEYDGQAVFDGRRRDRDGDGIEDRDDNCKKVFNPIRPMDEGIQADADGDGRGDACDRCPLAAGDECTAVDPYTGASVQIDDAS